MNRNHKLTVNLEVTDPNTFNRPLLQKYYKGKNNYQDLAWSSWDSSFQNRQRTVSLSEETFQKRIPSGGDYSIHV